MEEVKEVHKELPLPITAQWHQAPQIHLQYKSPFILLDVNVTKLSKWIWIVCAGVCSRMTQASLNANVAGR